MTRNTNHSNVNKMRLFNRYVFKNRDFEKTGDELKNLFVLNRRHEFETEAEKDREKRQFSIIIINISSHHQNLIIQSFFQTASHSGLMNK